LREENVLKLAFLDDFRVVDYRHFVANRFDYRHLVRDYHDCQPELSVQIFEKREYRFCRFGVERTRRFVAQQYLGVGHQRPRDCHALLLSARQLRRVGAQLVFEPHRGQQLDCLFAAARILVDFPGKLHVFQYGSLLQQVELLKYHRNLAPHRPKLSLVGGRQILAVYDYAARARFFE